MNKVDASTKKCARCGETKPASEYTHNKENKDGLFSYCRSCVNAHARERRLRNKEKVLRYQRDYYQKWVAKQGRLMHKERKALIADTGKKQCSKCKQVKGLSEFSPVYTLPKQDNTWQGWCRTCNNAYHAARVKRKYHEDPTPYLAAEARRRARKQQNGGTITAADVHAVLKYYGRACLRCGVTEKICLDHVVPLAHGGKNTAANLQPLCRSCNSKKGARKVSDYRSDLGRHFEENCDGI